jgi:pimeloyl-ACP methyl ester carboxylesterase
MDSKDPHFPDPAAEAASQADLPRCPVYLIDGAGHYPQSEVPGRTVEVLLPFLGAVLGTPARLGPTSYVPQPA